MAKNRLDIMPDDDLLKAIDGWRAGRPGVPPRATAARALVYRGLAAEDVAARKPRRATKREATDGNE